MDETELEAWVADRQARVAEAVQSMPVDWVCPRCNAGNQRPTRCKPRWCTDCGADLSDVTVFAVRLRRQSDVGVIQGIWEQP